LEDVVFNRFGLIQDTPSTSRQKGPQNPCSIKEKPLKTASLELPSIETYILCFINTYTDFTNALPLQIAPQSSKFFIFD